MTLFLIFLENLSLH